MCFIFIFPIIGIDFSAKGVYVKEDEWHLIQRLFEVDFELRREVIVDDIGKENIVLVPGTASVFLIVSRLIVNLECEI